MNFHVVKPLMFIYTSWSLENDVCHTVVFGNIATVVASCKALHWTQMADGSNVFSIQKSLFFIQPSENI